MGKAASAIKSLLRRYDIGLEKYSTLEKLKRNINASDEIELLQTLPAANIAQVLKYLRKSKSQIGQDLFVLSHLDFKRNGYFVEFGATNGIDLSNTYLLETEFGWTGILAEPAKCWHDKLRSNRTAIIEDRCVWKDSSSILTFDEADSAELSTIQNYRDTDHHKDNRKGIKTYEVKTISLNELLEKHNAPVEIDFLSIDTEGSEFEILSNFDFSKRSFRVITCEHNFTPMRDKLFSLLSKNGYERVFTTVSQFDDWYVKPH